MVNMLQISSSKKPLWAVADVHPGPPVPWPGVRPKKLLKKPKKLLKKNKYTTSR